MDARGFFDEHTPPIDQRLATGLHTLGLAVIHEERQHALRAGLSTTQSSILGLLSLEGAKTPSDMANHLGVSLPTVSDSVRALVDKGLVKRGPDKRHRRATLLTLTRAGRVAGRRSACLPEFLGTALGTLSDAQQERLFHSLVLLLRALQENGQIPSQRMCLTCTHFRPNVHTAARPHHCALVDAPMRATHLRLACDEHVMASPESQIAQWQQYRRSAG
jgi:DNA-binding MarR family transcriptional regulator